MTISQVFLSEKCYLAQDNTFWFKVNHLLDLEEKYVLGGSKSKTISKTLFLEGPLN